MTLPSYVTDEVVEAIANGSGNAPEIALGVLEVVAEMGLLVEDLAPQPHDVTDEDIEQTAQWLAAMSEHPRYGTNGYGWKALLDHEGNVDHAHSEAVRRSSQEHRQSLDHARLLLHDAIARRASEVAS
jgi:hypothetical protein